MKITAEGQQREAQVIVLSQPLKFDNQIIYLFIIHYLEITQKFYQLW
jgi:ABC-type oligopeptide transport system ATPase subunit